MVQLHRAVGKEHLYAVIRLDFYDDASIVILKDPASWDRGMCGEAAPGRISGTRAWRTLEEAAAEVRRLNALHPDGSARYFAVHLRLEAAAQAGA